MNIINANKIKPKTLNQGDIIIALSLSWGGPGACPHRYEIGKQQLENEFGVKVIEGTYTKSDPKWLYNNPKARADDLMQAFINPNVNAIFSTIGGEESIRMLPYIDYNVIKSNPKIFMGYSDTTISHFICHKAGIVSFYGPSIMAGFAENGGLFAYMIDSINKTLFFDQKIGEIKPNNIERTNEFLSRSIPDNQLIKRKRLECEGWRRIQGTGIHKGTLLGGCIDVFPFMIGTKIRPSLEERKSRILFLETSEERMSTNQFERIMRNLGSQGILHSISGILVGRSQYDYIHNSQINYDESLLKIIKGELGLSKLPIITNMDFGHTDPMFVLPLGCKTVIDCTTKKIIIDDNSCI